MSSNEPPCPIWDELPCPSEIGHHGRLCDYPRAGGRFKLEYSGTVELSLNHRPLTDGPT